MEFVYTPYILPLLFSAIMLLAVGYRTWPFRREDTGKHFLRFLLALEIWTAGFAFEIAATTLEGKLFWADIQFLGLTTLPIFWLETVMSYTGMGKSFRKHFPLIQIVLLFTNLVIWTNELHHLFRVNPQLDRTSAPFIILVNDYGLWFYLFAAIAYLPFLMSFFLLMKSYRSGKTLYRRQVVLLITSIIIPLGVDILHTAGVSPILNFNLTPMLFGFSAAIIGAGLFRLRLFDLLPIAYDAVLENMDDGVIVLDNQNRIVNINTAGLEIIHLPADQSWTGTLIDDATKNTPTILDSLRNTNSGRVEIELNELEDETKHYDVNISLVKNRRGLVIGRVIIFRDITERVRLFDQVERLATLDPLTGTYNRRYFFDELSQELARAKRYNHPVSLILLDVDHFKLVNDTYGHLVGDFALKEVVERCRENLRSSDIIGRYGGEEFIILLPETSLPQVDELAERIRKLIATYPIQINDLSISITVSAGATSLPPGIDTTPDHFVEVADNNLYHAKAHGRNSVVITPFET